MCWCHAEICFRLKANDVSRFGTVDMARSRVDSKNEARVPVEFEWSPSRIRVEFERI